MGTQNTADRIAQIALTILENEGPEAVSMRRVAEAVGITPMAIYHHFPSREALLNTITDREFAKLLSSMQTHPLTGASKTACSRSWEPMSIMLLPSRVSSTLFFRVHVRGPVNSRKIFVHAFLPR